jgi:hypothetical protein
MLGKIEPRVNGGRGVTVKLTAFDIAVPAATVIGALPDGWERR